MNSEKTIVSLKDQSVIADKCHMAECFLDRLIGLMGKRDLKPGQGMFFPRCNNVHMWFMRIPVDVVFVRALDGRHYQVTSCRPNVRPWKLLPLMDAKARHTLELPVGTVARCSIEPGDTLCIS